MYEIKSDKLLATEKILTDTTISKLSGCRVSFNFEQFYGLGSEKDVDLIFTFINDSQNPVIFKPSEESNTLLEKCTSDNDKIFTQFPSLSHTMFKDLHRLLRTHEAGTDHNSELVFDEKDHESVNLKCVKDIEPGEEIVIKLHKNIWLRKKLLASDNVYEKLIITIFLEVFNKDGNLPEKFKIFENFFSKWRSWTDEVCCKFFEEVLKIDINSAFVDTLHCRGYPAKVLLYRMLQTMGCVCPPSGAEYRQYPEALRNLTHQSRDLCFWPVQIADQAEQTEVMRRRMFDGIEFGPNATWTNFPKTKQVFMAAKSDGVDMIKDVTEDDDTVNLNAYGTCHYWTPLHVACFYGSQKVAKFLLSKKVIFNSKDRDGKTPLTLAEENGHTNLAKMLVSHAANESILADDTTEMRKFPRDEDPKHQTLEAAINCKNVGNTSYKNNNYKSAFKLYSRGIELCPDNHPQLVILYSNRAQVLITAKAYNLALRDIRKALEIDPIHDKTILRRAHCYEALDPAKSLMDLDMLLYISVPDKFIHNRRNVLFLQTLVENKENQEPKSVIENLKSIKIENEEHSLEDISMSALMDLSLDDLRDLDRRIGLMDRQQT